MATINRICVNGVYYDCERPSGSIRYAMGRKQDLPKDAIQVEIYMRSGDPMLYVVPKEDSEEPGCRYSRLEDIIDMDLTF